jgi:hypothetical protein
MKRIDVSLSVVGVVRVLDFLRPVLKALETETVFAPQMAEADRELAGVWREGLIHTQMEDCRQFLAIFDAHFLNTGQIGLTEENVDAILRTTAAVRIKVRTTILARLSDDDVQSGTFDAATLSDAEKSGVGAMRLMNQIQEVARQHFGA